MPNIKTISTLIRKAAPKLREAVETAKDIIGDIKSGGKIYKETGMNTTEIRKYLKHPVTTLGELHDTKQFIWKRRSIHPSRSVGRSIESDPKHSRLRNIAADYYKRNRKMISGENRANMRHFRDEVDPNAPRIRQPAEIRETQAAFDEHLDNTADELGLGEQDRLSDILDNRTRLDEPRVSDEEHRQVLLESMSPGFRQHMEGVANRHSAAAERRRARILPHAPLEPRRSTLQPSNFDERFGLDTSPVPRAPAGWENTEIDDRITNFGERRERATNEGFEQYIRRKYGRNPTRIPDED